MGQQAINQAGNGAVKNFGIQIGAQQGGQSPIFYNDDNTQVGTQIGPNNAFKNQPVALVDTMNNDNGMSMITRNGVTTMTMNGMALVVPALDSASIQQAINQSRRNGAVV